MLEPHSTLPGREGYNTVGEAKVSPTGGDLEGAFARSTTISVNCFTILAEPLKHCGRSKSLPNRGRFRGGFCKEHHYEC
jgi:hypothetical protein